MSKSLNEILGELDSLKDLEDYTPSIVSTDNGEIIYDEYITNNMARNILGNKYDPKCRYKLITMSNSVIVSKINDMWPEGKEDIYDSDGRVIDGHIVEYVLDSSNSEGVQSYEDMLKDISNNRNKPLNINYDDYEKTEVSKKWYLWFIIAGILMLGLWAISILFILNMKGV